MSRPASRLAETRSLAPQPTERSTPSNAGSLRLAPDLAHGLEILGARVEASAGRLVSLLGLGIGLRARAARLLRGLMGLDGARGHVLLHTITLTRWVAVIGQLFAILVVHFSLGIGLPLGLLLPAVAVSAAINLALSHELKANTRLSERAAMMLHGFDILQLCYILLLTGGIQNPFAAIILVPMALAAATLSARATMGMAGLALLALAVLTVPSSGLPWQSTVLELPGLYRIAIWVALSMATLLIGVFVWTLAEDSRRRTDALQATQLALAREQQLSALGGQAAAAAHLLGTPLGTITVIARELVRELPSGCPLAEDAAELLAQAQRCRELLKTLSRPSNDREHARFTSAPLSSHLEHIAAEFARPGIEVTVRVASSDGTPEPTLAMAPEFRHSLANLIDNAIQFAARRVRLTVRPSLTGTELGIEDDGPGFPPEILDWVGEPFMSTRREEGGLGLGIFIAITLLARTGATIHFGNTQEGAGVTIAWSAEALR